MMFGSALSLVCPALPQLPRELHPPPKVVAMQRCPFLCQLDRMRRAIGVVIVPLPDQEPGGLAIMAKRGCEPGCGGFVGRSVGQP